MDNKFLRVMAAICAHVRPAVQSHAKAKSVDALTMDKHYHMDNKFLKVMAAICVHARQAAQLHVKIRSVAALTMA